MLPEKQVESRIKKWLSANGHHYIKPVGGTQGMPVGYPDIISCIDGRYVCIEVKKPKGGKVSELQKVQISRIQEAGGIAFVANTFEVFLENLRENELLE